MSEILAQLLAFPAHPPPIPPLTDGEYDKQAKSHVHNLKQIAPAKLASVVASGGDILDILNPSINSLSYLHVLHSRVVHQAGKQKAQTVSEAFSPGLPLWQKLLEFMDKFDPVQIRYSGHEIRQLMELTARRAEMVQSTAAAIAPIRSAMLRIDPSCSTFTSSHLILAHLCLTTRAFAAALPVLDSDIYHIPANSKKAAEASVDTLFPFLCSKHESSSTYISTVSGLTDKLEYTHHLRYYLFGAMCYMGLKDWERAILFLEVVLTSPTFNTASKIQVEAYKKWVLLGLLHRGRMLPLPRNTNSQAAKICQNLSKPYTSLAEIFKNGVDNEESATKLVAEAQIGQQVFTDDLNWGLVRQVVSAYRQFSVQRLGKTYAALTIADVARRTSDNPNDYAETGQYVIMLISAGRLKGTISQSSGDPATWILRFTDFPEEGPHSCSEEQQHDDLVGQTEKIRALIAHVKEADRKYGLSKDYTQEMKRATKGKEAGVGFEEGNPWSVGGDAFDHEEDIMADL